MKKEQFAIDALNAGFTLKPFGTTIRATIGKFQIYHYEDDSAVKVFNDNDSKSLWIKDFSLHKLEVRKGHVVYNPTWLGLNLYSKEIIKWIDLGYTNKKSEDYLSNHFYIWKEHQNDQK